MAVTQVRGNSQIKDNTISLPKVLSDFLAGSDWNITNGALDATITGLGTPTNASDAATKTYVDGLVDSTLKAPDDWNSAGDAFPTLYKGNAVAEGDTFYITVAATLGTGTVVNVGDLLVAKVDTPGQTDANWFVMESNRDQATTTVLGVAKLATQVIADAGTNNTDIITPLTLATYLANAGIVEYSAGNGIGISAGVVSLGNLTGNAYINGGGFDYGLSNVDSFSVGADFISLISNNTVGISGTAVTLTSTAVLTLNAGANNARLANQPTGTEDLAISTTKYVDDEIAAIPAADVYTASNGITKSTLDFILGGPLTADTEITGAFALDLGTAASKLTTFSVNASSAADITSDVSVTLDAPVNGALLAIAPTGTVSLAVATTGYVDAEISAIAPSLVRTSNELPAVTNGVAAVAALTNLGTHASAKVANVEVHLNGIAQVPGSGNDYTLNALTGVITFEFNLVTGDVVLVHYDAQSA